LPHRIYSHSWSVGDTAIWDNQGVLHRAARYDPHSQREMLRTTVLGDEPIQQKEEAMAKTLLLVESRPASPEQVDDYHTRHEGTHVPKMLSVDGFVSARRWRADDGES
jgi:Taurine catabolism dioxygenase TauD, TfdA family